MQVLLFSFILLMRAANFFSSTDDIRWSADRRLEYSDFSGLTPSSSPWVANTSSNIYFSYDFNNDELHDITVYSSFTPSKSWMKEKVPEVLHHEQLHFDITELYARKLYLDASKLIGNKGNTNQLKQLFKDANTDCNEMQNQYDDESQHGVNEEKQIDWEKRIKQLLENTPAYPIDAK
jgi:hypothetical protein